MNRDARSLIQVSRCFSCLPKVEFNGALIYALCQWANAVSNEQPNPEPEGEQPGGQEGGDQ